jgi:NAD(P)-dependent dehydrogenase (short-subunit alcohol dehydrogenase family)
MFRLDGKTILITGASSGIGAHLASVAARHGATVIAAARRADALAEQVDRISGEGGRAEAMTLDVSQPDEVDFAVSQICDRHGPVDVLLNNAGIAMAGPAIGMDTADWDQVIATNLSGPFHLARRLMAVNIADNVPGNVINVASILGERGSGLAAAYAASKGGITNLTRALAVEWASRNVRVNALAPGYFVTDINRETLEGDAGDKIRRRIPMRRFGHMHDLDGPFLLLASDASGFMTGSVLTVDGGQSAGV